MQNNEFEWTIFGRAPERRRTYIGESIEVLFWEEIVIDEIKIAPGYFEPKWWSSNNRVKSLEIIINDKNYIIDFKDEKKIQNIVFDNYLSFKEIKFIILEVYNSNKDNDTGISEIIFYKDGKKVSLN